MSILALLGALTMNPWWEGKPSKKIPQYKRHIYKTLYNKMTRGSFPVIALRGPRQVGKTTLQEQMIDDLLNSKRLVGTEQILRIQFDDIQSLNLTSDPIITIIDWFEKDILKMTFNEAFAKKKPVYIFLDEIQDVTRWSEQLKHIVDHRECKIYVTGSSALRILAGRQSLAGRMDEYILNPLDLSEIAGFRRYGKMSTFTDGINLADWCDKQFWLGLSKYNPKPLLLESVFRDYSDFGGYPFCHKGNPLLLETEKYLLDTVVNRTIDHDLKASFGVGRGRQNATLLRRAFKVICKYAGQDVSLNMLVREMQNASPNIKPGQMRDLLDFFADSLLINIVEQFDHRLKKSNGRVKICLCDHAIRAAYFKGERIPLYDDNVNADLAGHIVESIIGNYLNSVEGLGLSFFPPKQAESEVDLVMAIGDVHIPVELKYRNSPNITPGLINFLSKNAYNAPFGLIITKNHSFHEGNIVAIPAKQFLLLK